MKVDNNITLDNCKAVAMNINDIGNIAWYCIRNIEVVLDTYMTTCISSVHKKLLDRCPKIPKIRMIVEFHYLSRSKHHPFRSGFVIFIFLNFSIVVNIKSNI